MRQIIITCLLLLVVENTTGQVQTVDSLVNVLEKNELAIEERMQLYWDILSFYYHKNVEKKHAYAEEALKIAEQENNTFWSARFSRILGSAYCDKSEYDMAIDSYSKAIVFAVKAKNKKEENTAKLGIGDVYYTKGDLELALKHFLNIQPQLETEQQYLQLTSTLYNIAAIYIQLHYTEKVLDYCDRITKIAERVNQLNTPLSATDKEGIESVRMKSCLLVGTAFYYDQQLDSALVYGLKAYESFKASNNLYFCATIAQMLTIIYIDLEDFELAGVYAKECLEMAEEVGEKQLLRVAWNNMSRTCFATKRYDDCEKYAFLALESDSTDLGQAESAYANICRANMYLGNAEKAEDYFIKFRIVKNKIGEKSMHESLADMETKYETEKKELRIASLEKERQLYIWLSIAGVLFTAVIGVILWLSLKNARREKQLIATQSVLDGEMKERARLAQDLHDRLSGNLSAVKMELGNHADTLQNVRDKLSNCIRDIRDAAHNLMPVSLQNGMKVALEDFAAQFPNVRFLFFGKEKRFDERTEFVVYCCACELVNNSIKHAGAQHINLQLVQDEKYVTLTVSDDGCGFDEKAVTKGFGLKSIRDRVASCNGRIDIFTAPGKGTETNIELKTKKLY